MATPKDQNSGDTTLVFAAHNIHTEHCGSPPRLRKDANPGGYCGYFENRYGEQFVFTFDRATGTGMVSGGDLNWDKPKAFTVGLVEQALRSTRDLAARIVVEERDETANLPVIDAAFALGRLTGLTGKDEVLWLRACLDACTVFTEWPGDHRPT